MVSFFCEKNVPGVYLQLFTAEMRRNRTERNFREGENILVK